MATSLAVSQLIDRQMELFSRISNSMDNLRKLGKDNINREVLVVRLDMLRNNWKTFEENHLILLSKSVPGAENLDYYKLDYYGTTEENYLKSASYFATLLNQFPAPPPTSTSVSTTFSRRLPNMDVPTFSGEFLDWLSFKDLFQASVINVDGLSNVEKLNILKLHVNGEASELIKTIQTTDANFEFAWNTLEEHYTNVRRLVSVYISNLLDIPAVTSESASHLKTLLSHTCNALSSLKQLKRSVEHWDDLLVVMTVRKLDKSSQREWESQMCKEKMPPTFKVLKEFLEQRIIMLESLHVQPNSTFKKPAISARVHIASTNTCALCNQDHFLQRCDLFRAKTPADREAFVRQKELCLNCLGYHKSPMCRSENKCRTCNEKHNTLLHEVCVSNVSTEGSRDSVVSAVVSTNKNNQTSQPCFVRDNNIGVHLVNESASAQSTLLATALVNVRDANGKLHTVRAMIDPCSQCSFVSDALCKKLQLSTRSDTLAVSGIGGNPAKLVKGAATLELSSRHDAKVKLKFSAYVLHIISQYEPRMHKISNSWSHLQGLPLADNFEFPPNEVDILLGADVYPYILLDGLIKGAPGTPLAQHTIFGWTLTGPISMGSQVTTPVLLSSHVAVISKSAVFVLS